jgi:Ca-activated chloride channel family protein
MKDELSGFSLLKAESGEEAKLAMEGLWLTGRVLPVGARLVVAHTFRSGETKPLEVVYAFGLPRDAALRRFKIVGEGFQVRSELRPVQEARDAYEKGISEGRLSTLARTYRDGRVNLSVGNIRPGELVKVFLELVAGVDLRDDGLRFRFPFTLAPCYHRNARAAEVEPGVGELELPEEEFGDVLLPQYLTDTAGLHSIGFDLGISMGGEIRAVASPSHALRLSRQGTGAVRVGLSREKDVPNRDLVLDVQTSDAGPRSCGGPCGDGKTRFTTVVSSRLMGKRAQTPKSVVFILDRSGSMQGAPIDQAKKAVEACLGALGEDDRFGFVAFDDRVEPFRSELLTSNRENREALRRFLSGIDARGGTELGQGVQAALKLAGKARAELVVVTDGQVAGTEDILGPVRASGARLHCLGLGAASQDRFLTLLAREAGGVSRFLTPRERVDLAALELFAAIGAPMAAEVKVDFSELAGGRAVLPPPKEVYEGHPLVVMGEAAGGAKGGLRVTWGSGGELRIELPVAGGREGDTVRLLQGARLITDLEATVPGELLRHTQHKASEREDRRGVAKLEELSREYGLASRATALVAVMERAGDDASQVPTTRVVPVGMPEDTEFESYFDTAAPMQAVLPRLRYVAASFCALAVSPRATPPPPRMSEPTPEITDTESDKLVAFAGRLLPDGGMPGKTPEERAVQSLVFLVALLAFGHMSRTGPFRLHVRKLVTFLRQGMPPTFSVEHRGIIERVLAKAEGDEPLLLEHPEEMLRLLASPKRMATEAWKAIEREVSGAL